jgi:type II secretory pathway component PulF
MSQVSLVVRLQGQRLCFGEGGNMLVTEEQVCQWTIDFCITLEAHDGTRSLLDHLQQATQQQDSAEFRAILEQVRTAVGQGYSLSHALTQYPEVFSAAYITTVRYGEIYGEVDIALRRYVERPDDRASRCRMPKQPAI